MVTLRIYISISPKSVYPDVPMNLVERPYRVQRSMHPARFPLLDDPFACSVARQNTFCIPDVHVINFTVQLKPVLPEN
jgi:hypothetical protein